MVFSRAEQAAQVAKETTGVGAGEAKGKAAEVAGEAKGMLPSPHPFTTRRPRHVDLDLC